MMYCTKCGTKVEEGDVFCPNCGADVSKKDNVEGEIEVGAAGIVFAILGKHAIEPEAKENCKSGLTMSIVGAAISFCSFIALYVILMLQAMWYMD